MSSLCCHLPVCRVMCTRVQDCSACVKTVLGDSIPLNNVFIPYLLCTVIRVDLLKMPQSLHNCWGALHICVINHDVACLCMNAKDKRKRQTRHKVTVKNKHFTTCSASSFSMENWLSALCYWKGHCHIFSTQWKQRFPLPKRHVYIYCLPFSYLHIYSLRDSDIPGNSRELLLTWLFEIKVSFIQRHFFQ